MRRAVPILATAALLLAEPALAQSGAMVATSQDAIGKSGAVDREIRQSDAAVRSMVRCIAEKLPTKVAYALSTAPGSPQEDRALESFQSRYEWCMPHGGHNGLRFNWTLVRGAFAEEMLRRDFPTGVRTHEDDAAAAVNPAADKTRAMFTSTARCTVAKAPDKVDALMRTEPFTSDERAAASLVTPVLSTCLDTTFTAKFSRQSLRALLADALYSYAVAGRNGGVAAMNDRR